MKILDCVKEWPMTPVEERNKNIRDICSGLLIFSFVSLFISLMFFAGFIGKITNNEAYGCLAFSLSLMIFIFALLTYRNVLLKKIEHGVIKED